MNFYWPEGNRDLVGNNDPRFLSCMILIKFLTLSIHKNAFRAPICVLTQPCGIFNYCHGKALWVTILMSNRGLAVELMHINSYGSHTYSL
ncbi:catalase [Bartonella sp. W8125]|uniref:catalase n=1 Tax=Bartonella TaxID=773 RepID=UPI0018DC5440|nr:catalase [Bartonella choladocola]